MDQVLSNIHNLCFICLIDLKFLPFDLPSVVVRRCMQVLILMYALCALEIIKDDIYIKWIWGTLD